MAIAGSQLAIGDFRMKKLVAPLQVSAQKAPVFGTVAQAINKLVEGSEKESAQSLLDLASLVIAILYTQGQSGCDGPLKPIQTNAIALTATQIPARLLKPLLEALTTKGSGRMEIIREAYEVGAFNDLRLVSASIAALDDVSTEIAEFMTENVLPKYGKAIVPEIRDRIDIKGRSSDARRLRLFQTLDADSARAVVIDAFENGSKEMRIAGLGCLGDSAEDLPIILEQTSAKQKDVRRVALSRLGKFTDPRAITTLIVALESSNRELVVESVQKNASEELWKRVYELTELEMKVLASLKVKDRSEVDNLIGQLALLLECYANRTNQAALKQLTAAYQIRQQLLKAKGSHRSGLDIVSLLRRLLLSTQDKKMLQKLVADREEMLADDFDVTLLAALLVETPKSVFDKYSAYMIGGTGKAAKTVQERRRMLNTYAQTDVNMHAHAWYHKFGHFDFSDDLKLKLANVKWDSRWVELAINANDIQAAIRFGTAKDAKLKEYLLDQSRVLAEKGCGYEYAPVLDAMLKFGYPEAPKHLLNALETIASRDRRTIYSNMCWLSPLIAKLPKSFVPNIEALLPKLPDQLADQIIPHLNALKAK